MSSGTVQRHDPMVISWRLKSDPSEIAHIEQVLRAESRLDAAVVDTVSAFPGGQEVSESVSHRVGDYFRDIHVGAEPGSGPTILRLTFHRRPDAGRFWKDVMIRILDSARQAGAEIEFLKNAS